MRPTAIAIDMTLVADVPASGPTGSRSQLAWKPIEAALLRQLGGGIPVWSLPWYPPVPASLSPFQTPAVMPPPALTGTVLLQGQLPTDAGERTAAPADVAPPPPSSIARQGRAKSPPSIPPR